MLIVQAAAAAAAEVATSAAVEGGCLLRAALLIVNTISQISALSSPGGIRRALSGVSLCSFAMYAANQEPFRLAQQLRSSHTLVGAREAAERGMRFAVLQLQVGTDGKACQEAWNAVQAAHPGLPALFVTADEGTCQLSAGVTWAHKISKVPCITASKEGAAAVTSLAPKLDIISDQVHFIHGTTEAPGSSDLCHTGCRHAKSTGVCRRACRHDAADEGRRLAQGCARGARRPRGRQADSCSGSGQQAGQAARRNGSCREVCVTQAGADGLMTERRVVHAISTCLCL